jgi:hypothetical protein
MCIFLYLLILTNLFFLLKVYFEFSLVMCEFELILKFIQYKIITQICWGFIELIKVL